MSEPSPSEPWRQAHLGHWMALALRRFDARVLREPDKVYEELQALAEPGFCDHSFIHLQEAANRLPRP